MEGLQSLGEDIFCVLSPYVVIVCWFFKTSYCYTTELYCSRGRKEECIYMISLGLFSGDSFTGLGHTSVLSDRVMVVLRFNFPW